jgi:hypothetical protein
VLPFNGAPLNDQVGIQDALFDPMVKSCDPPLAAILNEVAEGEFERMVQTSVMGLVHSHSAAS